jgi:adenylate kinase family enzyme
MTTQAKIYIIGPSGSGKSFLAKKLSKKYSSPILDLDDIFWKTKYTKEHTPTKKQELLQKFIKNNPNNWIIEGAPQEFLNSVSKHKPKIIWLNQNTTTLLYRVLKRFIFTKFKKSNNLYHKNQPPKETLKSLSKILRGIISYKRKNELYYQHQKML